MYQNNNDRAYDLPSHGLLTMNTLPGMNSLLWSKSNQKAVGYTQSDHANITLWVGLAWWVSIIAWQHLALFPITKGGTNPNTQQQTEGRYKGGNIIQPLKRREL